MPVKVHEGGQLEDSNCSFIVFVSTVCNVLGITISCSISATINSNLEYQPVGLTNLESIGLTSFDCR